MNSHVKNLRKVKGEKAVRLLEKRFGKPIRFSNLENVPVKDEVKIIELIVGILYNGKTPQESISFEAGRLHFRNFAETPLGRISMSVLPKTPQGFRKLFLNTRYIARHVFKNTNFSNQEIDIHTVLVVMDNSDYPIDHFRGLFHEWMIFWGIKDGNVTAKETASRRFEYTLWWP